MSGPRRVLFVNDYAEGGGAEVVLGRLRAGLEALDPPWRTELFCGARTNEPAQGGPLAYIYSRRFRRQLAERLEAFRPAAVHLLNYYHLLSPAVLDALREWKRRNPQARVVCTAHDFHLLAPSSGLTSFTAGGQLRREPVRRPEGPGELAKRWDHRGLLYSALKLLQWLAAYRWDRKDAVIDRFIAPGEFMRRALQAVYPAESIRLIRNPYSPPEGLLNVPAEERPDAGLPLKLVFIGRVAQEKGLLPFLRAVPEELWPQMELAVYGSGPQEAELERELSKGVMDKRVALYGRRSYEEIQRLLPCYHALLLPTQLYENAPLSLVEAAFAGLRLLVSEWGGAGQLAAFCGGEYLFDPTDADSTGRALRRLMADIRSGNPPSRDYGKLRGAFSFETFIQEHLRVYTEEPASSSP